MNPVWHSRTGSTAFLPQLATATELLVIDWSRSMIHRRILADGMYACLTPEKTQQRIALLAQSRQAAVGLSLAKMTTDFEISSLHRGV